MGMPIRHHTETIVLMSRMKEWNSRKVLWNYYEKPIT